MNSPEWADVPQRSIDRIAAQGTLRQLPAGMCFQYSPDDVRQLPYACFQYSPGDVRQLPHSCFQYSPGDVRQLPGTCFRY